MPSTPLDSRLAPVSLALLVLLQPCWLARADVVSLVPVADTTLEASTPTFNYGGPGGQQPPGIRAGGPRFGGPTRALMRFDIAGSIPAGATIRSATLTLTVTRTPITNAVNSTFDLHRVLAEWGEGATNAAPAIAGEASWNDRLGPGTPWAIAGGEFNPTASANQGIAGNGAYDFTSASLAADVQSWLNNPAANFGWLLRSESETTPVTIRLFGDRTGLAGKPTLVVDYVPVPVPSIFDLARLGNRVRFSFNAESNRTYAVEFRDSLTTGIWGVSTNLDALAAATVVHFTNTVAGSERYFRIRTP